MSDATSKPTGSRSRPGWRGWARRGALLVGALAVLALNLDALVVQRANPTPPEAPPAAAARAPVAVVRDGDRLRLGACWRAEHRGQHVLYVEGDPYTLGLCNAALLGEITDRQEATLLAVLERFVPAAPLRHGLIRALAWLYRDLPAHLTDSEKLELLGLAHGSDDPRPDLGPLYTRILFYHAIHDISQALVDNPILACSAFAASGAATRAGQTLLARVFDFEGGAVFDEDKVVAFHRPDDGVPFVSVVWAGMVGAVSGMNAEGIGIALNAAGSDARAVRGTPTTLLTRRVLQHARSLEDAVAILSDARAFVTDIFTVADGKTGEVAIVELTPEHVAVRRQAELALATNHLLHPDFASDAENAHRMAEGTTTSRLARLTERVEAARGQLDPALAVSILRDRALPGGQPAGLGHRGTIDALIAAHAVVFDLGARRLWVSATPHTLGEFVAYDLMEVLGGELNDHGALPADALLSDGGWQRLQRARARVEVSERALDDGDTAAAVAAAREALDLAPDQPDALLALARALDAADDPTARAAWEAVIAAHPPYRKHLREAQARLGLGPTP